MIKYFLLLSLCAHVLYGQCGPLALNPISGQMDCIGTPSTVGGADPLGSYLVKAAPNAPANGVVISAADVPAAGAPAQMPYNDGAGFYLGSGITWDNTFVGATVYYPTGVAALNDCVFAGTYTGSTGGQAYDAWISTAGTPDKFQWSAFGGVTSAEIPLDGTFQVIESGVTFKCTATTGHTAADDWEMTTGRLRLGGYTLASMSGDALSLGLGSAKGAASLAWNGTAEGFQSIALGNGANASGRDNIAIGTQARAPNATTSSIAIGPYTASYENRATVIGSGVDAAHPLANNTANSVCLGANSETCQAQVSANGLDVETLKTTGAATGKKVVCVDTATGRLYASSTGVDCSN